jgi:hypothetical protein
MVLLWLRDENCSWQLRILLKLEQEVGMSAIEVILPVAEIYDGVGLPAEPISSHET